MNNIIIHQAYYGEVNRSHGCLAITSEDTELKSFLTGFTDRPSSFPSGLQMAPYLSGTSFKEYYLLAKTVPSPNAMRGGMVSTHVLILPVEQAVQLDYVEPVVDLLKDIIPTGIATLLPLQFPLDAGSETPAPLPAYIQQTTTQLITAQHPVLFCGSLPAFTKTFVAIWRGLPPDFRRLFSFTAAFSTISMDKTKTLLHFQKNLSPQLKKETYISDDEAEPAELRGAAERFILQPASHNGFRTFVEQMNIDLVDWQVLRQCAEAYALLEQLDSLSSEKVTLLLRRVAKIAPQPTQGALLKQRLLGKLVALVTHHPEPNLKSLRNLPLNPFPSGEQMMSAAIQKTVEEGFAVKDATTAGRLSDMFTAGHQDEEKNWWHRSLQMAVTQIANSRRSSECQGLWMVLVHSTAALEALLPLIPAGRDMEDKLESTMPASIPKPIAVSFVKDCLSRGWLRLHAALLPTFLDPKEAARAQWEAEGKQPHEREWTTTKALAAKVSDEDLLSLAIETGGLLFATLYADRAITDGALLQAMDLDTKPWLQIWEHSLHSTNNLAHGVKDLGRKIANIFSLLLAGKAVPSGILSQIAKSPYADLSNAENRPLLWSHLPSTEKTLFLAATADALIEKWSNTNAEDERLESELQGYIASDSFMTQFLRDHNANMAIVVTVYEQVDDLKDNFLADYIHYYEGVIDPLLATHLGKLILQKNYHASARQVFEKAKRNKNFQAALLQCQSLIHLSWLDSVFYGKLFGKTASQEDVFGALQELAIQLYQQGPDDRDIWKRAGGNMAKLSNNRTREENWREAIALLQHGGGGKHLSAAQLLKEMIRDYPQNPQLKELQQYFK